MKIDNLLGDLRRLVEATCKQHIETGVAGMAEALATMFALLDQQLRQGHRLPVDWSPTHGRCKECRFWNRNGDPWERSGSEAEDYEPQPTRKRKCLRVLHANGCSAAEDSAYLTDPAIVTDGSGYSATFWTEPEFGCSSFESAS